MVSAHLSKLPCAAERIANQPPHYPAQLSVIVLVISPVSGLSIHYPSLLGVFFFFFFCFIGCRVGSAHKVTIGSAYFSLQTQLISIQHPRVHDCAQSTQDKHQTCSCCCCYPHRQRQLCVLQPDQPCCPPAQSAQSPRSAVATPSPRPGHG